MSNIVLADDIKLLIFRAAKVAQLLSIPDISLETNNKGTMIRGFSSAYGAPVLIHHIVDMNLPFQAFALNDCKQFIAKYELAETQDERFITTISVDDTTQQVKSVEFKKSKDASCKRFSLKFNAGNPNTVRAPKSVKDTNVFDFEISADHAKTMSRSVKAMGGEDVSFIFDGDDLSYEIKGGARDVFRMDIHDVVGRSGDEPFAYAYPFNTIYPALQHNDEHIFHVTTRGLLTCKMKGINIFILPRT